MNDASPKIDDSFGMSAIVNCTAEVIKLRAKDSKTQRLGFMVYAPNNLLKD